MAATGFILLEGGGNLLREDGAGAIVLESYVFTASAPLVVADVYVREALKPPGRWPSLSVMTDRKF